VQSALNATRRLTNWKHSILTYMAWIHWAAKILIRSYMIFFFTE